MQHLALRVDEMVACPCGGHSVIRLSSPATGRRVLVRIGAEYARTLAAYDAGFVSGGLASVVSSLVDCMKAIGVTPLTLVLSRGHDALQACLRLQQGDAQTDVAIEPGVGFLVAKQLQLEILLSQDHAASEEHGLSEVYGEAHTDLPDVYRRFLESLDLEAN